MLVAGEGRALDTAAHFAAVLVPPAAKKHNRKVIFYTIHEAESIKDGQKQNRPPRNTPVSNSFEDVSETCVLWVDLICRN